VVDNFLGRELADKLRNEIKRAGEAHLIPNATHLVKTSPTGKSVILAFFTKQERKRPNLYKRRTS
jgi:hypothetical protein